MKEASLSKIMEAVKESYLVEEKHDPSVFQLEKSILLRPRTKSRSRCKNHNLKHPVLDCEF